MATPFVILDALTVPVGAPVPPSSPCPAIRDYDGDVAFDAVALDDVYLDLDDAVLARGAATGLTARQRSGAAPVVDDLYVGDLDFDDAPFNDASFDAAADPFVDDLVEHVDARLLRAWSYLDALGVDVVLCPRAGVCDEPSYELDVDAVVAP